MSDIEKTNPSITGTIEKPGNKTTTEERLSMLIRSVGNGDIPKLSEEQTTKILNQREKAIDYVHADRKQASWDQKYYFTGFLIFFFLMFLIVTSKKPEYLPELLSLMFGLIGGTGLGYKLGKGNTD